MLAEGVVARGDGGWAFRSSPPPPAPNIHTPITAPSVLSGRATGGIRARKMLQTASKGQNEQPLSTRSRGVRYSF